jgi:hypothetical protein
MADEKETVLERKNSSLRKMFCETEDSKKIKLSIRSLSSDKLVSPRIIEPIYDKDKTVVVAKFKQHKSTSV